MILTIIAGLILFTIMVISHEFGHFIVAKLSGIGVIRFSIGLGPRLFGFRFHGTDYIVSLLPLGGYVKMKGMDPGEIQGEEDEFFSKSIPVRTLAVFAGPFLNLILAFIIYFFIIFFFGLNITPGTSIESAYNAPGIEEHIEKGDRIVSINNRQVKNWYDVSNIFDETSDSLKIRINRDDSLFTITYLYHKENDFPFIPLIEPIVGNVKKDSPADKAGIKKNDKFLSIERKKVDSFEDMRSVVHDNPGKKLAITWKRDGKIFEDTIIPTKQKIQEDDKLKDVGLIGVIAKTEKIHFGFFNSVGQAFEKTIDSIKLIIQVIIMLFRREISPKTLGGPIAIFQLAGESARLGMEFYLGFMALLSIHLFIFNLIPFPPLDGGHILLFAIEKISGKRPTEKQMQIIQQIGFAILLVLIAFIFYNDIMRIRNK
jgi:regulator of sigma E protease